MKEFSAILQISVPKMHPDSIVAIFGREACSCHETGDVFEPEMSYAPIRDWAGDVVLVSPNICSNSGITEPVDWCCDKLVKNSAVLTNLMREGMSMHFTCWCNSSEKVGDVKLSSEQIQVFSKFGISFFFRFVVNEVFN